MKGAPARPRPHHGFIRRVLSVPIFWKVLGIGMVVAILFGSVTFWQSRTSTLKILHRNLTQRSLELARSLAVQVELPLLIDNTVYIQEILAHYMETIPDIRYIVVHDTTGKIVAHTFRQGVPESLLKAETIPPGQESLSRVFTNSNGLLFDTVYPILQNQAGELEVALTDQSAVGQLSMLSRAILWTLVFCVVVGIGLAWALTYVLTLPLHSLDQAAHTLGEGKFSAKSEVFYDDEIGRLASTFNQMASNLEKYRQEILEKEKTRLFLLDKIVRAQEEERRTISRELHDQMGQSLSAILFSLQSESKSGDDPPGRHKPLEVKLRGLIGDVQKLAWNMRPSILDDYGLDSSLARYAEEMSRQLGITVDYQYLGPPNHPRLPEHVETTLYRITQEAITNVARHAAATRASIVVIHQLDNVTLLVEDNGRGFKTDATAKDGLHSLGLTGMKERAGLLGGTCVVESEVGKGTAVRIQIPLEKEMGSWQSAS